MNNTTSIKIERPSLLYYIAEPFRAIGERIRVIPFLRKFQCTQKGDGHPVIVIPGFMGNDSSVKLLSGFLNKHGYQSQTWGLGMNFGNLKDVEELSRRIEKLFQAKGEKISLIGWSLGGVYARQIAKRHPEKIRQVITMCSPFLGADHPNNAAWLFSLVHGGTKITDLDPNWLADLPSPAPVPTTALYSKTDGVVPWQTCMESVEDAIHQNIEIKGSHIGVIYNKNVLPILIDRLQYSEENWKKF